MSLLLPSTNIKLALVQVPLAWEAPEANREHIEQWLNNVERATDLILLPEMFSTAFSMNAATLAEPMGGPSMQWMQAMARRHDALLVGSLILSVGPAYYNRLIAMGSRGVIAWYDKRHCFRMGGEHQHYTPGSSRVVFSHKGWRICPQICYDLRFPAWSRTRPDAQGPDYDLLLYLANWPAARAQHWNALLQARAIENQCVTLGVNRIGKDGKNIDYQGDSSVYEPSGTRVFHAADREGVFHLQLEAKSLRIRERFPAWMDADLIHIR